MIIKFTKGSAPAPSTIHCTRSDGSYTHADLRPGIEIHDMIHYAVETILEFHVGFYGLLNQGYLIQDFELSRQVRPPELIPANLPVQAIQSEFLVNQLMVETIQGIIDDFIEIFKTTLNLRQIPFPEKLNEDSLDKIRKEIKSIKKRWADLPEGKHFALSF